MNGLNSISAKTIAECAKTGFRPLVNLVVFYPLLLLVVVGLWSVVWGYILVDYDAFHQVWHESWLTGITNGMLIAFILGIVVMSVNLADEKAQDQADSKCATPDGAYRFVWVLLIVVFTVPFVRPDPVKIGESVNTDGGWRVWFPLGMLLTVALYFGSLGLLKKVEKLKRFDIKTRHLGAGVLTLLGVGYLTMTLAHAFLADFYFPFLATSVCASLLVAFVAAFLGAVTYVSQHRAMWLYPAFLVVVVLPFLFPQNQIVNRLPNMTDASTGNDYYTTPKRLTNIGEIRTTKAGQLSDIEVPKKWHELMCDREKGYGSPQPIVLVTCSGGASASAIYTADVLFTLEDRSPGFSRRIRLVSGASGGMLGAAYFVTQLRPGGLIWSTRQEPEYKAYIDAVNAGMSQNDPEKFRTVEGNYRTLMDNCRAVFFSRLEADFLSPIVQKWIHKDIPLSPYGVLSCLDSRFGHTTNDRGAALEQAWSSHLNGALDVPFRDLRAEEATGELPSLVFTPMMIEDGRQLIISNLDLDYMTESGRTPRETVPMSYTGVEFFKLFPHADTFRLSTAVRMNASFPFFSPSAALPTDPVRHVVDAGYYDNYGMVVATKWLNNVEIQKFLMGQYTVDKTAYAKTPEIVLLQIKCFGNDQTAKIVPTANEIRAYAASKGASQLSLLDLEKWRESWLAEKPSAESVHTEGGLFNVTAPFTGLFSAWRANMVYRSDERLSASVNRLELAGIRLNNYKILCYAEPSLNWVLTKYQRDAIHNDITQYSTNAFVSANFNNNRSTSSDVATASEVAPPSGKSLPKTTPPPLPPIETSPKLDSKVHIEKQTKVLVDTKKLTPTQLDSAKDKIKLGEFQSNLPLRYQPKK